MDVARINTQPPSVQQIAPSGPREERPSDRDQSAELHHALIKAITDTGNAVITPERVEVRLTVDRDIQRVIARVVESESGEVVREVPPEELVQLAKKVQALLGALLDRRV